MADPNRQLGDTDELGLRRLAIVGVLLAGVVAVPASIAFIAAFGWDLEAAISGNPSGIIDGGPTTAALLRWGAIGDMFFSYLLLVPLALYLNARLRPRRPWLADLGALGAFAYIFVGAAGAAILASSGPPLIEAYATARPSEHVEILNSFETLRNIVFLGLWQTLDVVTLGVWILSVGWLIRPHRRILGALLVALGLGTMTVSVLTPLGLPGLIKVGIALGLPGLAWAGWLIVDRAIQQNRKGRPASS
jgi:hypothetical protein